MIYPEAHIWPYYNGIRPFPDTAFAYPVREQVPAVGVVVVYRQRKLLRFLPPCITVVVGEPVYPDASLPPRSARRALHQKVYTFMCDTVARRHSYDSTSNISPHRTHNRPRNDRAARPERWDPAWHI